MSFLKADADSAHVKFPRGSRHLSFLFPALQKGSNKYRTIEDNIPYRHDWNLWSF